MMVESDLKSFNLTLDEAKKIAKKIIINFLKKNLKIKKLL